MRLIKSEHPQLPGALLWPRGDAIRAIGNGRVYEDQAGEITRAVMFNVRGEILHSLRPTDQYRTARVQLFEQIV
jgi:hypothetical protein